MHTKWIVAFAFGGALALAACSSNPPATPGTTTPPPDQNGPTDPVDPPPDPNGPTNPDEDTRTQAQKDFDASLEAATTGLADARAGVTAAAAAAGEAETDDERTTAQVGIDNARKALIAAVAAAEALEAPSGDSARLGERAVLVLGAQAAQTADEAKLTAAAGTLGQAGFDTALANARTGLQTARASVATAVAAADAARTGDARTAAQTGIGDARMALTAASAAAEALAAPSGDTARTSARAALVAAAEAARTADEAKLAAAEARIGFDADLAGARQALADAQAGVTAAVAAAGNAQTAAAERAALASIAEARAALTAAEARARALEAPAGDTARTSARDAFAAAAATALTTDSARLTEAGEFRTETEIRFDRDLGLAKTGLANARTLVANAARRAAAATTDEERSAAQAEIINARMVLDAAVKAARALVAPAGDPLRIGQAAESVDEAVAAQTADLATLLAAEGNTGWAGGRRLVNGVAPWTTVTVVRNERQNADGGDSSTLLKAEDIPPVMYTAGKVMLAEGSGSSGDRLRMRGIPIVYNDSDDNLLYGNKLAIDVANNQPNLVAGLRITGSGLVVDIGGKNADSRDFRLAGALETEITRTGTVNGYDLTLSFGKPTASPTGNAEHYWEAALMPDDEFTHSSVKAGDTTLPLGTYFVRLSNHAGVNLNLEDPNDKAASAMDDTYHYLSYAAYGFMDFRGPEELSSFTRPWVISRVFPFHVGYDAFADRDEMKVTNVADADKITEGKFKGRTIAAQVDVGYQNDQVYLPGARYGARLRGGIELTATISGDADDNKISGRITNLQLWNSRGFWDDFRDSDQNVVSNVVLGEGDIADSGSFSGDIAAPTGNFGTGKYEGNFYGPLSGLEAAGTWFVEGTYYDYPLVGSFGAALVRDDGTYGVTVPVSN